MSRVHETLCPEAYETSAATLWAFECVTTPKIERRGSKCNKNVCTGDMVLTVQHLVPEHDRTWGSNSWNALDRPWENPRGRGEANRTHDCNVDDCTLYPVNLVEYDDVVKMVRYRFPMPSSTKEKPRWQYGTMSEENWKRLDAVGTREFVEAFEKRNRHVFVSVKKETNWRRNEPYERAPRANFELYDNEYINLTYMNSVWLGWAITQKKLGDWKIGGKTVDYAYGIRYLKTAMEYIRVREKDEKSLLDALDTDVCKDSEWPLRLSEWKMKKGVRALTPYQAKRFVKTHRASK